MNRPVERVIVRGAGISALSCAWLLHRHGVPVEVVSASRRFLPAITLAESTAELLCHVFEDTSLMAGAHVLESRRVVWSGEEAVVRERSFVVSEEFLLRRLSSIVAPRCQSRVVPDSESQASVTVFADYAAADTAYRFGSRTAELRMAPIAEADSSSSAMSADGNGWSFSVPVSNTECLIQRVRADGKAGIDCVPRLTWPAAGRGWFRCGPAATAVDPLCGDGAGYAVRSALWVSALICALNDGADPAEVVRGYNWRVALALQEHLGECFAQYSAAPFSHSWRHELRETERGIAALHKLTSGQSVPVWRLEGLGAARLNRGAGRDKALGVEAVQ